MRVDTRLENSAVWYAGVAYLMKRRHSRVHWREDFIIAANKLDQLWDNWWSLLMEEY